MKKYIGIVLLSVLVLSWCTSSDAPTIDVNAINDLSVLQTTLVAVSERIQAWTIDLEEWQHLVSQLQQKYLELTDTATTQSLIESQFDTVQHVFDQQSVFSYTLPFRAKKMWMTEPIGMTLDKTASKRYITQEWSVSTLLVYTGEYTIALQQAKIIAEKAWLHISEVFEQWKKIVQDKVTSYISGLEIATLTDGIMYVNHDLLDTNIDTLLTVSVDQNGVLTIETTQYN